MNIAVTYFKGISYYSPVGNEEFLVIPVRRGRRMAKNRIQYLLNERQDCY
jgi:hypothetical protein